jgi:hypothetical protein
MVIDLPRIGGETSTGLIEQLRDQSQVSLRTGYVLVADVCRELRKQGLDVLSIAVPCEDTMNDRRMAKIMEAGFDRGASWDAEAGSPTQAAEMCPRRVIGQALSLPEHKYCCGRRD